MMRILPLSTVIALVFLGFQPLCQAGLKVYYIRHAEGGHNVVNEWKDKPKSEWPSYVGNDKVFTPKGEKQVAAVPEKLAPYKIDFVACSPLWRTRNTILEYLKVNHMKAEIWPELEEYHYHEATPPFPPPSATLFGGGKEIEIAESEKDVFTVRPDAPRRFKIDSFTKEQSRGDVEALMKKIVELITTRFGGQEKSILLVGHGNSSGTLLKELTGKGSPAWAQNTGVWMAEQQADGSFKLMMFNDQPIGEHVAENK